VVTQPYADPDFEIADQKIVLPKFPGHARMRRAEFAVFFRNSAGGKVKGQHYRTYKRHSCFVPVAFHRCSPFVLKQFFSLTTSVPAAEVAASFQLKDDGAILKNVMLNVIAAPAWLVDSLLATMVSPTF
jgi:hypothetical protein